MVDETASSEFIQSALVEAEKVAKKQKTSAAKTNGVLHKALHQVEACLEHLRTHPDEDAALALGDLLRELEALDAVAQVSADTKELHGAVAKLGKVLDRGFSMDICVALRDPPLDRATLDRIVAEHLYQEGAFEVADAFVQEARVPGAAALKGPYVSMYAVVAELRKKNLAPAMAWADEHKAALRSPSGAPSKLVVSLHRLAFLQTLQQQGQLAAVAYARQHFKELYATHPSEVKRLMGMLCYAKRAASIKRLRPYEDLFGEAQWEGLVVDFKRQCCAMLGQAQDSPLLVTVAAGAAALPTLLKLATVVAKTQPAADFGGQNGEMAVEIPLGKEFVFHSIFACPVSREQSTPDNPPMMLPCGHCMCKQSILKIAKSAMRAFKCPYCPLEATMQQCMELHFPDAN